MHNIDFRNTIFCRMVERKESVPAAVLVARSLRRKHDGCVLLLVGAIGVLLVGADAAAE